MQPENLKRKLARRLPYVRGLLAEVDALRGELQRWRTWQPPGHFYSPVPSAEDVRRAAEQAAGAGAAALKGLDLNVQRQLALLREFGRFADDIPFPAARSSGFRYWFDNEYFSYADAVTLHCMLRHLRPRRVVEVGSGFSSALMLDTNERFLGRGVEFTFIEPHPQRLQTLLRDEDRAAATLVVAPVQDVELEVFGRLEAGDFLFVDSSHVSKAGSDVNFLLFEVLPVLARGVHVHFHDVFFPFGYPREWLAEGVAWNEAYALRAFLQYNAAFEVEFFVSYLVDHQREQVETVLPLMLRSEPRPISFYRDAPGGSLWLRKA